MTTSEYTDTDFTPSKVKFGEECSITYDAEHDTCDAIIRCLIPEGQWGEHPVVIRTVSKDGVAIQGLDLMAGLLVDTPMSKRGGLITMFGLDMVGYTGARNLFIPIGPVRKGQKISVIFSDDDFLSQTDDKSIQHISLFCVKTML